MTARLIWRGLPPLLAATLPLALGALLTLMMVYGGAALLAPVAGALTLGPAWHLLAAVARRVVRGEPVSLRWTASIRPGLVLAVPVFVPAQLAVVTLAVLDRGGPELLYASLAANLVALGCALLVAPFAYAAGSWRLGAAVAASSPMFVVAGLAVLVLAGTAARLFGPPLLIVVPGLVAACVATAVKLQSVDMAPITLEYLAERARKVRDSRGGRVLIGITGAPGAGKSTLAESLLEALGPAAALVPMDGFHLSQRQLAELGREGRKGAPDTFDAAGFAATLRRVRETTSEDVFVPSFDRALEEPIAAGLRVPAGAGIVFTEGNYLLLPEGAWADARRQLDETWMLDPPGELRRRRLTDRHVEFGRSPADAVLWVERVDEPNARLVDEVAQTATLRISAWS